MEGLITSIIAILIISFISNFIKGAKKSLQKPDSQNNETSRQPQSLQSIIRDQVSQHKDALLQQFDGIIDLGNDTAKSKRYSEGDKIHRKTLEGTPVEHQRHSHDAHIGGSYNEGDKLDRKTLEGTTLESDPSYGEGDDVFAAERTVKSLRKPKRSLQYGGGGSKFKELKMNRNSIVTGVIMSEILEKRGGRRAVR